MVVTVTVEPLGTLLAVTARFLPSISYESDTVISLASGVFIERVVSPKTAVVLLASVSV